MGINRIDLIMEQLIQQTIRDESGKALATLIRLLRDIDLAEDVLQDSLIKAIEKWPLSGIPKNPAAWLIATGKNRAIDLFRHRKLEQGYIQGSIRLFDIYDHFVSQEIAMEQSYFNDDLLRLIFTCCHPGLSVEAQLALTLKTVVGFSLPEIGRAFVANERTIEQRIVRAKRKIKSANIPYEIPEETQLEERLESVLLVVYLIFNEGYMAMSSDSLIRQDLCNEALRLARLIRRLFKGNAEVMGLLALLLFQNSRRGARVDDDGCLVPLEKQNRALWFDQEIQEGCALVEKALRLKSPGPYQIQAAISALHCQAPTASDTDWLQISFLYFELEKFQDTPIVQINKTIAISMVKGVEFGIRSLESMSEYKELKNYLPYHASLAELYRQNSQVSKGLKHFNVALSLASNPAEIKYLKRQIADLSEISS